MKILDCTLRDGGYTNNWDFDINFAINLYETALNSDISYLEVGYMNNSFNKNKGVFATCDDSLLEKISTKTDKCQLIVMTDANRFDSNLFVDKSQKTTPLAGVRIATYPQNIVNALMYCKVLKDKGYEVFLNLMVAGVLSDDAFRYLENHSNDKSIDWLVFSDSFGNMTPDKVENIAKTFINIGFKNLGFHSHNNLQMALINSITAMNSGCSLIDATVKGLGRGAGNLPIELFLGYLERINTEYTAINYVQFIENYFPESTKYLCNLISGLDNIHPSYLEYLAKHTNKSISCIYEFSKHIKNECPIEFNKNVLEEILNS